MIIDVCVCVTRWQILVTGCLALVRAVGSCLRAQPQPVNLLFNYSELNIQIKFIKNSKHKGKIIIKFLYTK